MPININGKQYVTVAERVTDAHRADLRSIITECVLHDPVLFKATVVTEKGTFTGWSAANPSKRIEAQSPYEVAETSAVGRALGFAGFGSVEGIASADEMTKGGYETSRDLPPQRDPEAASPKQINLLLKLIREGVIPKAHSEKVLTLSKDEASRWIDKAIEKQESARVAADAAEALGAT